MKDKTAASLFGLNNSNRNFSQESSWGKNQFNSSFPAALCCYLEKKGLEANYLTIKGGKFVVGSKKISDIYGISSLEGNIFFAFEAVHTPYQRYVKGTLPRTDLVIQNLNNGDCIRGLEVKLTALPDHVTSNLGDKNYGSEIVVRPDTIVYLACSFIDSLQDDLYDILNKDNIQIRDWSEPQEVINKIDLINNALTEIALKSEEVSIPFLLQPIWKTNGKSPELSHNCLDVFVWSNSAFCWFISNNCNVDTNSKKITRHTRTSIWLYKMLYDYIETGTFDHEQVIDNLSYNTKNDKAFASNGIVTNQYMACNNLTNPRILKEEIKNIILGGGQKLLSPERRFDAIIYNSPELFEVKLC